MTYLWQQKSFSVLYLSFCTPGELCYVADIVISFCTIQLGSHYSSWIMSDYHRRDQNLSLMHELKTLHGYCISVGQNTYQKCRLPCHKSGAMTAQTQSGRPHKPTEWGQWVNENSSHLSKLFPEATAPSELWIWSFMKWVLLTEQLHESLTSPFVQWQVPAEVVWSELFSDSGAVETHSSILLYYLALCWTNLALATARRTLPTPKFIFGGEGLMFQGCVVPGKQHNHVTVWQRHPLMVGRGDPSVFLYM